MTHSILSELHDILTEINKANEPNVISFYNSGDDLVAVGHKLNNEIQSAMAANEFNRSSFVAAITPRSFADRLGVPERVGIDFEEWRARISRSRLMGSPNPRACMARFVDGYVG